MIQVVRFTRRHAMSWQTWLQQAVTLSFWRRASRGSAGMAIRFFHTLLTCLSSCFSSCFSAMCTYCITTGPSEGKLHDNGGHQLLFNASQNLTRAFAPERHQRQYDCGRLTQDSGVKASGQQPTVGPKEHGASKTDAQTASSNKDQAYRITCDKPQN